MDGSEPSRKERYQVYWEQHGRKDACERLASTSFFILVCQGVFIGLDYWAYPEHFALFFPVRMAVNLIVVAILVWGRFHYPRESQVMAAMAVGLEILVMIYATGGPNSLYYTGLLLVLVGMPVLMPVTPSSSLMVSAVCALGFAASPFFADGGFDSRGFSIALIFVLAGAFESAISSHMLTRARVREFEQRCEIEQARDRLRSLDEAKTRFAANVHHELRTPLTLMLAPVEALRDGDYGDLGVNVDRTLRTMQVNGRRLLNLINNLLDLAKLESRSMTVTRRPLDMASLARDLVDGARPMAERKGLVLAIEVADSCPSLFADREALEKVLVNLIGNALKFTETGSITVQVGAANSGDGIDLAVVDTGIGLEAHELTRVFDRFAQVDASATREHEGTGIGLSLASELVALHEGRIWAESDGRGCGATMRVWLPTGECDEEAPEDVLTNDRGESSKLADSMRGIELERSVERWEDRRGEAQESASEEPAALSDAPEIVVADDNRDMRELLRFLLAREFRVRTARNGREALELVRERLPALVVTDVMMPEMSGTELCREIKTDPTMRGVPVMLVSSKAESEMKIEGLELGADDYVTKPFHPRELMARVRGLVSLRTLQLELAERNLALERALVELQRAEVKLVQSERLAAVGELAAGIAHEVNNPVNFALNSARALKAAIDDVRGLVAAVAELECGDPEKLALQAERLLERRTEIDPAEISETALELVGIVTNGLERTQQLVGDLRDFASPGARLRVAVDLRKGIASTASLLGPELRDKGIELTFDIPEELPAVQADPSALNQVFLNLIKNAAEAMEEAGSCVRVQVRPEGDQLVVEVSDDGPGISPEHQARLFEPFFTTKEAGKGTGLGLSIAHQIIEAHGGTLTVASEVGEGARFQIRLPLAGHAPSEAAALGAGFDEGSSSAA